MDPPKSIPCEGIEASGYCAKRLLDSYTTPLRGEDLEDLSRALGAELAGREVLEDVNRIIALARDANICVYIYGDPFLATTHQALRVEAIRRGVGVKVVYAAGFINALFGELGLHFYKLGSISTLVEGDLGSASYVYMEAYRSLLLGKHSVVIISARGSVQGAIRLLEEAEANHGLGVFRGDRWVIVASRVGLKGESIRSLKFEEAKALEPEQPVALVVPAGLHFTEEEALKAIGLAVPQPSELVSEERARAERIIGMVRGALEQLSEDERRRYADLVENVELYIQDAEGYLGQRDEALALMQAAYAEGLLDALRLLKLKEIRWPSRSSK